MLTIFRYAPALSGGMDPLGSQFATLDTGRHARLWLPRLDRVDQYPHLAHFDLHRISRLHPHRRIAARADAARCAGDDDVARLERGEGRDVVDEPREAVDHLLGGSVLHDLAVEPRLERQFLAVRDLVAGDHPRAESAGAAEVLARGPLQRVALPVAHRAVVVAGVARDVLPGFFLGDAPPGLSDDDRDLALVVEVDRFGRHDDSLPVPDLRLGDADE